MQKAQPVLMKAIRSVAAELWPGVPVIPMMDVGASDAVYTSQAGMPTYGMNGVPIETSDNRAHGRDERLPVASLETGLDFYYKIIKLVAAPAQ